jgi:threonine dehydrogenase-like Zn-dependent dehydrogenase
MSYLHSGEAAYPVRIGHEWSGVVTAAGAEVAGSWVGRRVTGDTMLGCGRCARCTRGRQHLCAERYEIGIRGGWPGALAERLVVPARALVALPGSVDAAAGALVEPGGNAVRAVTAARLAPGDRLLVAGPGTIGLLTAMIAAAGGTELHLLGVTEESLNFAATLGFDRLWNPRTLPDLTFDAVIDASNGPDVPALAAQHVEPGGRIVLIGLAGRPSLLDTRILTLKEVTAAGVLSASGGLQPAVDLYASGTVDPRPLIATTLGINDTATALTPHRPPTWGPAPKILIDPHR